MFMLCVAKCSCLLVGGEFKNVKDDKLSRYHHQCFVLVLLHVRKNPSVQEKVAQEVMDVTCGGGDGETCVNDDDFLATITDETLQKMQYLHAALTENIRLYPVTPMAGPCICLGKEFAYRQMKIFSIAILRCFRFKLADDKKDAIYKGDYMPRDLLTEGIFTVDGNKMASIVEAIVSEAANSNETTYIPAKSLQLFLMIRVLKSFFDIFWKMKKFLNIGSEAALKRSVKEVDNFVYKLIHNKMEQLHDSKAILQLERWLDKNGMFRSKSPFKFIAFQAGPRICLGKEFAYRQMKIFSAVLLRCFVFK
ncbi:hypothetical protein F3Y22_tig00110793pilonHSYRG00034 [Hibiscus syriacus]|uniref:Cytochrome P450 n=1 Tax=Hibiscus syriacus TaxID=106335 RepID=A0A6A2ZR17_HIBSY|nr:hypothetical protein F3Y22_tig00110793pilonHSYRG00034 [Hibiscus syriacus]